jgi:hypothetical protein
MRRLIIEKSAPLRVHETIGNPDYETYDLDRFFP